MEARALMTAWVWLVALSIATTLWTLVDGGGAGRIVGAGGVLLLAGLKARIILARYLRLERSRFWMSAFGGAIGGFLALAFAIYLAGMGGVT